MTTATTHRVAALGACLLGILLFLAAPATAKPDGDHPSGNGATQGASHSNPDGGGVDKPYAAAGQDAMTQGDSDWDGNNGCGNDADREDDNNGHCGKPHDVGTPPPSNPSGNRGLTTLSSSSGAHVLGVQITAPAAPAAVAAAAAAPAQVLGTEITAAPASAELARTGSPIAALTALGLTLVVLGAMSAHMARKTRPEAS